MCLYVCVTCMCVCYVYVCVLCVCVCYVYVCVCMCVFVFGEVEEAAKYCRVTCQDVFDSQILKQI